MGSLDDRFTASLTALRALIEAYGDSLLDNVDPRALVEEAISIKTEDAKTEGVISEDIQDEWPQHATVKSEGTS